MGRPQIDSVDKYITYPIVYSFVPYFKDIHPIYITIACIVSKYFSILLFHNIKISFFLLFIISIIICLISLIYFYLHKTKKSYIFIIISIALLFGTEVAPSNTLEVFKSNYSISAILQPSFC